MRASSIPGPVRVALAVDGGIAAVYGMAVTIGVPDGRLGGVLVAGEAAVWAAVVLAWVFPSFWARWSAAVERLFVMSDGDDRRAAAPLAPWPPLRSQVAGATALTVLLLVQVLTSSGGGVAFRSVVSSYVVAAGVGAAGLAVISDLSALLTTTRADQ